MFSFTWDKCPELQLLGSIITICLVFEDIKSCVSMATLFSDLQNIGDPGIPHIHQYLLLAFFIILVILQVIAISYFRLFFAYGKDACHLFLTSSLFLLWCQSLNLDSPTCYHSLPPELHSKFWIFIMYEFCLVKYLLKSFDSVLLRCFSVAFCIITCMVYKRALPDLYLHPHMIAFIRAIFLFWRNLIRQLILKGIMHLGLNCEVFP